MSRSVLAVFGAAIAALALGACAASPATPADAPVPSPSGPPVVVIDGTQQAVRTAKPTKEGTLPEQTPTPAPTATPDRISKTTGRRLLRETLYQPALVVIGNDPLVRPQSGLMQADIIYELPMEGSENETRLLAVYADEYPVQVGPVRDARSYITALSEEWGGMLVFDGYPSADGYPVYNENEAVIPGMYGSALQRYFLRDETVNAQPENTLFCKLSEMTAAVYGKYSPAAAPDRFGFETGIHYENGKPILKVGLPFASMDTSKIEFVYDKKENMLYRYERNSKNALVQSKTLTFSEDGKAPVSEPLRVRNLIVQYVKYDYLTRDYRDVVLLGVGNCDYFINGEYISGQWRRESEDGPTRFYMRDGSPLLLEPGTTWIALQTGLRDVRIRLSAGE